MSRPAAISIKKDVFPPKAQPYIEEALERLPKAWREVWELSGLLAQAAVAPGMVGTRFADVLEVLAERTHEMAADIRKNNDELGKELDKLDVLA